MRILKVIPQAFYSTRGTPLSAYHRARELEARGHEVDIVTYAIGAKPPGLNARIFRSRGPHFSRYLPPGPSRLKIWFDMLLFINLLYRLARCRYDLLYAHEEGAFLARIAGAIFRVPYVYDMHSSLPLQITDWKFSRSRRVVNLFRWVEQVSVRGACAVVAISPAVERAAKQVAADVRSVVIVNHFEMGEAGTADQPGMIRERYSIPRENKLVLYAGSFVELQALDLLIDAVPLVVKRVPDVMFLLVGGSEPEIVKLREQAERLGVSDRVILAESRPQQEIPAYLAAADVLVSPRVQGINPPGKLFSYLASGRPVVATNTLVHNQLLDESCAILTPPNAAGLAEGLVQALTDQGRADDVVREAQQFLRHYCSQPARDAAYGGLFAAVAACKRA
ncbi:MAG TPA: glycosyltransferase family 4 protein [Steroidobacteraceae bacterium]